MGWKGTMRSINAEANRQAKLAEKRQKYQQKQEAHEAAYNAVVQQENLLENYFRHIKTNALRRHGKSY
jgi:hypothetical protein